MKRLAWLLGVSTLAGCAGSRTPPTTDTYRFPATFDVVQTVVVVPAKGPEQTLLASLSRRPDGLEVSFFDPVFQTPLFRLEKRAGEVREERFVPGGPSAEQAGELLSAMQRLFEADDLPDGEFSTFRYRFVVDELREFGSCRFPARIELVPRAGPVERVIVRTVEAACPAPAAP